ncbi:MAG: helix-turn-helix transcriptional regulator [Planctomycetota bacterium]|nr:helix-turn-helix transcriptional regulator [Planctomycetota bacterium]
MQVLAARVRELREGQGRSQAELGRAAGLAASQILKLERGEQAARIVTIEAVAEALGVSVSELLATGPKTNPRPDRADRLAERIRALGDHAIGALERVVEAMELLARGRS